MVAAIPQLAVFELAAVNLAPRPAVDDGHIVGRIALRLLAIVDDAVAVGVFRRAAVGIESPRPGVSIPKAGAVTTADDDLAAAVAVDVVDGDHVVLAGTNVHIRAHVNRPQARTVEQIGLELVALPLASGIKAVGKHGIYLTVAVEVHRPCVLTLVVIGIEQGGLEIEIEEHVLICLLLKEERIALLALNAAGHDGHGKFRPEWHDRACRLIVGPRDRLGVDLDIVRRTLRPLIKVVRRILRFLRQLAPCDQNVLTPVVRHGDHGTAQLLLYALRRHGCGQKRGNHEKAKCKFPHNGYHCFSR